MGNIKNAVGIQKIERIQHERKEEVSQKNVAFACEEWFCFCGHGCCEKSCGKRTLQLERGPTSETATENPGVYL